MSIKVEFNLNNSPKDITITDLNSWGGVFKSLFKIVGPSGVIYLNAGYDTDDYTSPDTTNSDPVITGIVSLPLDISDAVLLGSYTVYVKTELTGTPTTYESETYSYFHCFENPIVSIDIVSDCTTSILTSTDSSTYEVNCSGTAITPTATTRTHTIKYPTDTTTVIADIVGSGQIITAGPNIWTGMFTTLISSVLQYTLPTGLFVNTTVTGIDYHEVACGACLCDIYACMKLVYNKWVAALGINQAEANRLQAKILKMDSLYVLYMTTLSLCGDADEAAEICAELRDLLATETTCCENASDISSVEVIPTVSGSGGGSVTYANIWIDGVGVPSSAIGTDGDYYIVTTAATGAAVGDVYSKSSGAWTYQFSTVGPSGADAVSKFFVLNTDVITAQGAPNDTNENILKTYTYTTPSVTLAPGDYIEIEANFEIAAASTATREVHIYFGSQKLVTATVVNPSSEAIINLRGRVYKVDDANQKYIAYWETVGLPTTITGGEVLLATEDLTSNVIIKATGQMLVSSTFNGIKCNYLNITQNLQ